MAEQRLLIAGGGIGGLAPALQQIGVDCVVLENVRELKPLGVGVNLQPKAVRELIDMRFDAADVDALGCRRRNGRWSG